MLYKVIAGYKAIKYVCPHESHSTVRMDTIEPEMTTALDIKHQVLKKFFNLSGTPITCQDPSALFSTLHFKKNAGFN